jgi:transposase
MKLCARLDTSVTKTAIRVVNSRWFFPFETTEATDPAVIFAALAPYLPRLERVSHEAGTVSSWLQCEITAIGVPMLLLESRHAAAASRVQRNKTVINGGPDEAWTEIPRGMGCRGSTAAAQSACRQTE